MSLWLIDDFSTATAVVSFYSSETCYKNKHDLHQELTWIYLNIKGSHSIVLIYTVAATEETRFMSSIFLENILI